MIHYTLHYVQFYHVFFTFKNPAVFEKYLALASFTFFSAACGFTISKPYKIRKEIIKICISFNVKNLLIAESYYIIINFCYL